MAVVTKHSVIGFAAGFATCGVLAVWTAAAFVVMAQKALVSAGAHLAHPPVPSAAAVDYGFRFRDLQGAEHSLGEYRGRVVVLNLWVTWCGPCRMEMPSLAKLRRSLAGDAGAAILCVSQEPLDTVKCSWISIRERAIALGIAD